MNTAEIVSRLIRSRRSIRAFAAGALPAAELQRILAAGVWAPSGLNNQPWKFLIVEEAARRKRLAQYTKHEYRAVLEQAATAVCVFLDTDLMYNRDKDVMAIGACVQNMLLQAHAAGWGACWLGEIINRKSEIQQMLETAPCLELMAVIAVGLPAEKTEAVRRDVDQLLIH